MTLPAPPRPTYSWLFLPGSEFCKGIMPSEKKTASFGASLAQYLSDLQLPFEEEQRVASTQHFMLQTGILIHFRLSSSQSEYAQSAGASEALWELKIMVPGYGSPLVTPLHLYRSRGYL